MTNYPRFWVVLLAALSFLAGLTGGRWMAQSHATSLHRDRSGGELAGYETLLVQQFELSGERARCLRVLLQDYETRVARVQERHLAQTISAFEPELAQLSEDTEKIIRDQVLPPAQRAAFDRLSEPLPFRANTP